MAGCAWAQVELSGEWANRLHEDQYSRGPGLEAGEWEGLPMNAAARMKSESWDADVYTLPERQCIPFPADMGLTIGNVRIWGEVDPPTQKIVAWHVHHEWQAQEQVIWMDDRPRPPAYAAHTWQGFSLGRWEGNTLTVETTHMKWGYLERNGVPRSDLANLTEHYIRHGDVLTIVQILYDPVYLAAPMIRTRNLAYAPTQQRGGYSCRPTTEVATKHPAGWVPHHLPGTNTFLDSATKRYGVPPLAARGGVETIYPDFLAKLKTPAAATVPPIPNVAAPNRTWNGNQASAVAAKVSVLHVQGGVYMLVGAGANITVQVGDEAVTVVDTGFGAVTDQVLAAIRGISEKPIRYVINTSTDRDHTGGNEKISKAGNSISGNNSDGTALLGEGAVSAAGILAPEKAWSRMAAKDSTDAVPVDAQPTEPFLGDRSELFNGEPVQILAQPAAHTDADSIVFFRRSDVISAGDVLSLETYPVIDRSRGGSINGTLAALNRILDLAVPRDKQEGGTYIIPGHGRLCDEADVVEYRDMVTIIHDRIADMVKRGMNLDQVKAAHPTMDYDARYGSTSGSWTTDRFIDAVYRDLGGR
jgi:glyoxylase-like metal-dependent hydrolase (beta-lactamase superfamily II)